tara:strand:- start:1451 stop:1807 length:357 start_codon:yes stop_codon:yes gene_type:complete
MSNSEQQSLFHCFCREIAKHLRAGGVPISEDLVKRIVKKRLGNTRVLTVRMSGIDFDEVDVMSTTKYKPFDTDLNEQDNKHGFISMENLITSMVAWSSTDLGLQLISTNEKGVIQNDN